MKVVRSEEMKKLDMAAIYKYGIPGVILMENAGISVLNEVLIECESLEKIDILVICGTGNNGGDGLVVARHLYNRGIEVNVCLVGEPSKISGDTKVNYDILIKMDFPITVIKENEHHVLLEEKIHNCNIIIDALLGTGIDRNVDGAYKKIIDTVNNSHKKIISIDISSGICADSGSIKGTAVKADKTVVLQLPKVGNINYPGAEFCGEIIVKDIGIPFIAIEEADINLRLITKEYVKEALPRRKYDTHKGNYGKAYMVAGSTGMTGAAMLASEAVLRSGAGILKLAIPQSLNDIMEIRLTEGITVPLPELRKGTIGINDIEKIISTMEGMDVIAIGPGCGESRALEEVLRNVFERTSSPVVLDADALNALAKRKELLEMFRSTVVLTPHPAEMSRLTSLDVSYINENRIEVAQKYSEEWNAIVVLKGARTVVAEPGGSTFINPTGNPGMATAGSGDVLTGTITGLLAQNISPFKAVCAAVYIHGFAGERAADRLGQYGMIAGDIMKELPRAIKDIIGQ